MKLLIAALIVASIADLLANHGRGVAVAIGYFASTGHWIATMGAMLTPSMGG